MSDQAGALALARAPAASIVAGCLEQRNLAEAESEPERFFMNVALLRVLYARALAAAPGLALWWFAPLDRVLGNPIYAWPFEQRHVWRTPRMPLAGPLLERATRAH